MTIMFGLKPGSRPATTARTSSSADTQITTSFTVARQLSKAREGVAVKFLSEIRGLG